MLDPIKNIVASLLAQRLASLALSVNDAHVAIVSLMTAACAIAAVQRKEGVPHSTALEDLHHLLDNAYTATGNAADALAEEGKI